MMDESNNGLIHVSIKKLIMRSDVSALLDMNRIEIADLWSWGWIALRKCRNTYNSKKAKFSTYAVTVICREIMAEIAKEKRQKPDIRKPVENANRNEIKRTVTDYFLRLGFDEFDSVLLWEIYGERLRDVDIMRRHKITRSKINWTKQKSRALLRDITNGLSKERIGKK